MFKERFSIIKMMILSDFKYDATPVNIKCFTFLELVKLIKMCERLAHKKVRFTVSYQTYNLF